MRAPVLYYLHYEGSRVAKRAPEGSLPLVPVRVQYGTGNPHQYEYIMYGTSTSRGTRLQYEYEYYTCFLYVRVLVPAGRGTEEGKHEGKYEGSRYLVATRRRGRPLNGKWSWS